MKVVAGTCKRVCYNFWSRSTPTAGGQIVKAGSQVIDTLVSKLPNAIELYLGSVPLDDPVRFLSCSP